MLRNVTILVNLASTFLRDILGVHSGGGDRNSYLSSLSKLKKPCDEIVKIVVLLQPPESFEKETCMVNILTCYMLSINNEE